MSVVDFLILLIGTSIALLTVCGKPAGNHGGITLPGELARVVKRKENSATYLEQCGVVEFPDARRGFVNVVAFLDSSWPYSHRQAIMLNMLNNRLQNSGLRDTLFFLVNIDPYYRSRIIDTSMEDEIEREAWLGVSPEEIEGFVEIDKTFDSLVKSVNAAAVPAEINVVQDNEDRGVWRTLGGSRDQVLVIDRCGKLTYQVIVPWSILHFPYVKAAILSTYNDEPCGPCDLRDNKTHHTRDFDYLVEASSETFESKKGAATLDVTSIGSEEMRDEYVWETSTVKVNDDATKGVEETTLDGESRYEDASSTSGFESTILDLDVMDTTRSTVTEESEKSPTIEATTSTYEATSPGEIINGVDKTLKVTSHFDTIEVVRFDNDPAAAGIADTAHQSESSNRDTTEMYEATTRDSKGNIINELPKIVADFATENSRHLVDTRGTPKMADENISREIDSSPPYVPIRIIMHAPHFHVDTDSTRMHEYLVLKTGSANSHGHLASDDATRLYRGPQDYKEKKANSAPEEIEDKKWPMKNLIFNKDESTGLFGEVADYWRDLANPENYDDDDADETDRPDDDHISQEDATEEKSWKQTTTPIPNEKGSPMKTIKMDEAHGAEASMNQIITKIPSMGKEEFSLEEENTRHKLIAHYSKLLPWIYYVLDE